MTGKVCMVTGANSGIGKATAEGLSMLGAEVILVCRDSGKGKAARVEIIGKSGNESVELMIADLSSLNQVRVVASEFRSTHSGLDVLVNNAGSNFARYEETSDGLERTMALNYFSPFLLSNLLLPSLRVAAPSRVVNVASVAHFGAKLDLEDLNGRNSTGFFGLRAYSRSKLALVLFTYEFAKRLQGSGVTVNCVHPGAVRTNIWKHVGIVTPLAWLPSLFMGSPKKGAETILYLATSPEVETVTGKYFVDREARSSSRASYDAGLASALWELSARTTGLTEGP